MDERNGSFRPLGWKEIKPWFLWSLALFALAYMGGRILVNTIGKEEVLKFLNWFRGSAGISKDNTALENLRLYFLGNGKMVFVTMILGLIPFLCISGLSMLINGCFFGGLYQAMAVMGSYTLWTYTLHVAPHGLIELVGLAYMVAVSMKTSWLLGQKIRKKSALSVKKILLRHLASFLLVAIPIIAVGAVVEAYITPLLVQ
ncbi:MAG: stage II sporulation protein M [Tissierellia bacterium]|nr:stage II sporulation protein M [Tissierellia bacterium]